MSNVLTSDISKWFDRKLWKSDAAAADDDPVDVLAPMQGAAGLRQMRTRFLQNKDKRSKYRVIHTISLLVGLT